MKYIVGEKRAQYEMWTDSCLKAADYFMGSPVLRRVRSASLRLAVAVQAIAAILPLTLQRRLPSIDCF